MASGKQDAASRGLQPPKLLWAVGDEVEVWDPRAERNFDARIKELHTRRGYGIDFHKNPERLGSSNAPPCAAPPPPVSNPAVRNTSFAPEPTRQRPRRAGVGGLAPHRLN